MSGWLPVPCGTLLRHVAFLEAELSAERDEITRLRAALGYISSPTMGLPGGADAATFCMDGATEQAARIALQCCIETARQALGGPS